MSLEEIRIYFVNYSLNQIQLLISEIWYNNTTFYCRGNFRSQAYMYFQQRSWKFDNLLNLDMLTEDWLLLRKTGDVWIYRQCRQRSFHKDLQFLLVDTGCWRLPLSIYLASSVKPRALLASLKSDIDILYSCSHRARRCPYFVHMNKE